MDMNSSFKLLKSYLQSLIFEMLFIKELTLALNNEAEHYSGKGFNLNFCSIGFIEYQQLFV